MSLLQEAEWRGSVSPLPFQNGRAARPRRESAGLWRGRARESRREPEVRRAVRSWACRRSSWPLRGTLSPWRSCSRRASWSRCRPPPAAIGSCDAARRNPPICVLAYQFFSEKQIKTQVNFDWKIWFEIEQLQLATIIWRRNFRVPDTKRKSSQGMEPNLR